MSGNKGGTAACGSKKPTSAKGSRPERQGKKKRLLNMKEKGEVLDKLDAGMGPVAVGNLFNISESTVRGIRAKRALFNKVCIPVFSSKQEHSSLKLNTPTNLSVF